MLLYNLSVRFFHFLARAYSNFNLKAKYFIQGREESFSKLQSYHQNKSENEQVYWFHCASLGEFEQARPLMEALKNTGTGCRIALSFFSPSGYQIQKNYDLADLVFYLPMDTRANAEELLRLLEPKKIFFIKYEFWLNYLTAASKKNIPLYLVSALFRPGHIFFKWYGKIFLNILPLYSKIFVQDQASSDLLKKFNVSSTIAGDTRFDRVLENKSKAKKNLLIESFAGTEKIIVLGSSWPEEEELIFKAYDKLLNYKIIIAPHDISRQIAVPPALSSIRYSALNQDNMHGKDVLIIDNIGMLATLYHYASLAFVGGGYRGSLHNILEAAVFGIPVIYGPQTQKHPEAEALQEAGGGIIIQDPEHLKLIIKRFLNDEPHRMKVGIDAGRFIENNSGATQKILSEI